MADVVDTFIGIGSNLDNRIKNCDQAIKKIVSNSEIELLKLSSLYETNPVGYTNQPKFINQVCNIKTSLTADHLLDFLLKIESDLGRVRDIHWGPRIIDLDLLFFGQQVISLPKLIVPHPLLHERQFVLVPLEEINPDFYHPVLRQTVRELLQKIKNDGNIVEKIQNPITYK